MSGRFVIRSRVTCRMWGCAAVFGWLTWGGAISDVSAQSNSMFSPTSNSAMSASGRSSAGTNGMTGMSRGNTAGRTGGGNGMQGGLNLGLGTQNGLLGNANNGNRQGLVGRTDSSGRFVGNEQMPTNAGNQFGQNNLGRTGRRSTLANQNQQMGGQGGNSTSNRRPLQARHRVAFDLPAPTQESISQDLQMQLQAAGPRIPIQGVQIEFELGELTLRGTVATEDQRLLAAQLARLEPGVRSVKNELVVQSGAVQNTLPAAVAPQPLPGPPTPINP